MTRDETIALWQRCEAARKAALAEGKSGNEAHEAAKAIWNAWAGRMLEARRTLEASGQFIAGKSEKYEDFVARRNDEIRPRDTGRGCRRRRSISAALSLKSGRTSAGSFFPGRRCLAISPVTPERRPCRNPTTFAAGARFSEAIFHMDAVFDWSEFNQAAGFRNAEFRGIARFNECNFNGTAWFFRARFFDDVWFGQCNLAASRTFRRRGSMALPHSARPGRTELLLWAKLFAKLPDLVQTSFRETPRLDNVSLPAAAFFPGLSAKTLLRSRRSSGRSAAWP